MRVRIDTKRGDWSDTEKWLKKCGSSVKTIVDILQECGAKGVAALSAATPVDTGKTASSWEYRIEQTDDQLLLIFTNNNTTITDIPIPILIQYGHGNGSGVHISGRDFINPAMQPIFDEISERIGKELC